MTAYARVRLELRIESRTGLHIGTGFGLGKLLDERTTRGPHRSASAAPAPDLPYIPGASLKGRLRASAAMLVARLGIAEADEVLIDLFGSVARQARLTFADAHLIAEHEHLLTQSPSASESPGALIPTLALETRAHVALSRLRRAARDEFLRRLEVATPRLIYATEIMGWLPNDRHRRELAVLVCAAHTLTHIGGHKSRGLGAVAVHVERIHADEQPLTLAELAEELRRA